MTKIGVIIDLDSSQRIDLVSGNVVLYISSLKGEIEEVKPIAELIKEEIEEIYELSLFADAEEFKTDWIDETIKLLSDYRKRVIDFKGE